MSKQLENKLSSREVAPMMDIEHKNLLRKIDGINEDLLSSKVSPAKYWIETSSPDNSGKQNKEYQITKRGCEFLANKTTGTKGNLFTDKYMDKFELMENKIKNPLSQLSKELQSIIMLDQRTVEIDNRLIKLENNMTIDYEQQEILNGKARYIVTKALGGKDAPAYKECNRKAFSELWRCYKRIMQVNSYKNTAAVNYDKAREIIENWKPNRELELMILGANSQLKINL